MKKEDCTVFPDKIMMEKILKWYKKIKKEKVVYKFQYTNKPTKKEHEMNQVKKEIERLAKFILKECPKEPGKETSESAVDVAIRLLKRIKKKRMGDEELYGIIINDLRHQLEEVIPDALIQECTDEIIKTLKQKCWLQKRR